MNKKWYDIYPIFMKNQHFLDIVSEFETEEVFNEYMYNDVPGLGLFLINKSRPDCYKIMCGIIQYRKTGHSPWSKIIIAK